MKYIALGRFNPANLCPSGSWLVVNVSTWRENAARRGPKFEPCPREQTKEECASPTASATTVALDRSNVVNIVLDEMLGLFLERNATASMVVAPRIKLVRVCKFWDSIAKLVTLHTIPSIVGSAEYHEDSVGRKFTCEKS